MAALLDYAEPKKLGSRPLLARLGFLLALFFIVIVEGGHLMRAIGWPNMSYAWDNYWDLKSMFVLAAGFAVNLLAISQPETRTILAWLSLALLTAFTCSCIGSQFIHPIDS